MIDIDKLILEAYKEKQISKRECYKMIKSKFQEWNTSENNVGKTMDEAVQISILKKLKKEYENDAEMYRSKNSNFELATQYESNANDINELLPQPVDPSIVEAFAVTYLGSDPKMKLSDLIRGVSKKFPGEDGKDISNIVRKVISEWHEN